MRSPFQPYSEESSHVEVKQEQFQQLPQEKKFGGHIVKVGDLNAEMMKQFKDETLFYIFYNMPH